MRMGEYIKYLRKEKHLTQEELADKLSPKVGRSAIAKWEQGATQNIRRDHIAQMAEIFDVNPVDLMCLDDEGRNVMDLVQAFYGRDSARLLNYYNRLNLDGRKRAVESVGDLSEISKYRAEDAIEFDESLKKDNPE